MAARGTRPRPDPALMRLRVQLAPQEASTYYTHDVHEAMTTTMTLPTFCTVIAAPRQQISRARPRRERGNRADFNCSQELGPTAPANLHVGLASQQSPRAGMNWCFPRNGQPMLACRAGQFCDDRAPGWAALLRACTSVARCGEKFPPSHGVPRYPDVTSAVVRCS